MLTHIDIPASVTTIRNEAFYGCTALRNIVIPDSVRYFGENIFSSETEVEYKGKTYSASEFQDYVKSL